VRHLTNLAMATTNQVEKFDAVEALPVATVLDLSGSANMPLYPKKSTVRPGKRRRSQRHRGLHSILLPLHCIRPTSSKVRFMTCRTFNQRDRQCTGDPSQYPVMTPNHGLRLRLHPCYNRPQRSNHLGGCTPDGTLLLLCQALARCHRLLSFLPF